MSLAPARVRFAPSPTGYLHIGGVRTALFNWLWARKTGGQFILRIEDTDRERSTPESKAIILDALRWLGLTWDEGPEVGGPDGPYEQTGRLGIYQEYAERLIAAGKAYRCYCTKEELADAREALKARDPKAKFKYPGTCRDRKGEPDKPHVVRFKARTDGSVVYTDRVFGRIETPNVEQQDFVIMRSDGVPLYNFGAVVDDMAMRVTLVARGRDHMINTPPQIMLYEAFGATVPEFAHLPMMLAPNGEKLSKRHGAVSVTEYREQGYVPGAVLNYLARFGWSHGDQEIFSIEELVDAFSWEGCGRGDGKFDTKKFLAVQYEHVKSERLCPDELYVERLVPFLERRELSRVTPARVKELLPAVRERSHTLVEAADRMDFFFRDAPILDEKAKAKFLTPEHASVLEKLRARLADEGDYSEPALEAAFTAWLEREGLEMKQVAQPARVALTGRTASPGLYQVMALLGKDATLARLDRAIGLAKA